MLFQRKNTEQAQLREQLDMLEEKYRHAEERRVNLEARVDTLVKFMRIMAHDIRGPVGNLEQLCGIIAELSSGEEELNEYVELLPPTIVSIQHALQDLGTVIDIQTNTGLVYEDCRMDQVLDAVRLRLQDSIAVRQAVITSDFGEPVVNYPRQCLENILYHLLRQAVVHTKPEISPYLSVSTGQKDRRSFLRVEVNGTDAFSDKGSSPFAYHRPGASGTDRQDNGLYYAKNQVEALGGWITVVTSPGHSTQLTVFL